MKKQILATCAALWMGSVVMAQEVTSHKSNTLKISVGKTETASGPAKVNYPDSDVESNIPTTTVVNENAIAVVIGNRDYKSKDVPAVSYAIKDAETMKKYLISAMGFKDENILYYENASQADFNSVFGKEGNYKGLLYDYIVKPDETDVFVFYSGHGAPDLKTKEGYFVPVDCNPASVALNGFSIKTFYENLGRLNFKSLTIVTDACFSGSSDGGMLIKNASPIFIAADTQGAGAEGSGINLRTDNRVSIFSSSQGDQISSWYPEKSHSIFTYYFLRGLQGEADRDTDKTITVGELKNYLKEKVPPMVRRLHRRDQNPDITGNPDMPILKF